MIASYTGLEFEPVSPTHNGVNKKFFTYDQSLARLRQAGFQRHPLPSEAFALLIDGLEGKLEPSLRKVTEDMKRDWGEWLSMALKFEGSVLHCYEHPENLNWNGNTYDASRMTFTAERTFQLRDLRSTAIPNVKDLANIPGLVEYLWSKPYPELPSIIKQNAFVWIRIEKIVWPVGRGVYEYAYSFDGQRSRSSRGVRPKISGAKEVR